MTIEIIGGGFGRTGTLTLKLALERLGFGPCYHMVEVFRNSEAIGSLFEQRMRDHDHVIEVFNRHNAEVRRRIPPERLLDYDRTDGPRCASSSGSRCRPIRYRGRT